MTTITVWLFFILGTGPVASHQVVDHFPTQAACEAFRHNVQQMLEQGASPGSRVSPCLARLFLAREGASMAPRPTLANPQHGSLTLRTGKGGSPLIDATTQQTRGTP